jgi:hypothetical protein
MNKKQWRIAILLVGLLIVFLIAVYNHHQPDIYRIPSDPDSVHEINFFALGDQGTGDWEQKAVARAMEQIAEKKKALDFVILLGDNFYDEDTLTVDGPEWRTKFEEIYSGTYLSTVPFYAVLGNHDVRKFSGGNVHPEIDYSRQGLGSNRWRMPDHFFHHDFGNINGRPLLRMVFLDTNTQTEELLMQAQYIREQFIDNPVKPIWKAVVGHHSIRSYGKHYADKTNTADILRPAMQDAHVDFYLSAHDHNQQLIVNDGEPAYIINGAGGQKLYSQKEDSEDLRFFREGFGFVDLKINAIKLNIDFYDTRAEKAGSFELARSCNNLKSSCIQTIKQ